MLKNRVLFEDYIKLLANNLQPLYFHTIYGSILINQN